MDKIIVKKYDEVYNKIECDPGVAMELADQFTFEVPGAKFMPAVRNKVWDGKIRIFNPLTCTLYAGLNEYVEKFCQSRNYEYETEGLENDKEFSVHEAKRLIEKMALTKEPRDYQIDAYVHAVRKRRALLLSPTASGKSLIIYMLTRHYATNTLIIVPTTSLVHQMASDFVDYGLKGDIIHKIMGGLEKETNKPIVISTWQSLFKLPKKWFDRFNLVIGDESHLFKSKSLTTIMTNLTSCQHRFGFTGTLDGTQTNRMVLEGLFGPVRKVTTTSELMKKGTVAELKIKALVLKYPDYVRKEVSKMDYQAELDLIVTNQSRNKFIKNLVLSLTGNTIVFFNFVEKHGRVMHDMIKSEAGDRPIFFISGDVSADERERIRHTVESSTDCIILASSGTTSTGTNIINLQNIVFTSPSKSRIRNLQSIGRGLRKSGDKLSATLYDIADDLSWKSKKNHTILHFLERIKIYSSESFDYKIYPIDLK
jgi:superfamily II DNA or RNA helicase